MNIKLENIGIVGNSDIQLDGLTIITGQNNSGKTTVGKVIYSLIDAVSNLQTKAANDKSNYIRREFERVESCLELFRFIRIYELDELKSLLKENSCLYMLLKRNLRRELNNSDIEKFAHDLYDELASIDLNDVLTDKDLMLIAARRISKDNDPDIIREMFNDQVQKALVVLKELFNTLEKDMDLIEYTKESIYQTIKTEFDKQLQPVSREVTKSKIELTQESSIYFNLNIIDNKIVDNGEPVFISSPYKTTYFIDNPFILDSAPVRRIMREQENYGEGTFLNAERILDHENKLKFILRSKKQSTIFEEVVLKDSLSGIKALINEVIPGEFEFSSDGEYYVLNGKKLSVTNLATGSKMFSIIKILLEKGEIDNTTMLVLDEPEAHLHPSWQNKFAEIIVLLVKELNANILLTSHSPNFVLAIDAYMRKHNISSKTNFYQTTYMGDNSVEYKCVNDDIGKIYADFMQYLSEVKSLRDMYIDGCGGKS